MVIFKQLLKEFWFPASVAVTWSFINYYSSSNEEWGITKIVNIAAPTFFFTSWLTAQYFRVRKQEHVSSSLLSIDDRVENVLGRMEDQANEIQYLLETSFYQTFDECLYRLRESKEELADLSRAVKSSDKIDANIFSLKKGNPFYNVKRELDKTIGYANHVLHIQKHESLDDRFTRLSYHIEEVGGQISSFIGRLNHQGVAWGTKRTYALVLEITDQIEYFNNELLQYSKYSTEIYKGGRSLNKVLSDHVTRIRKLCA